MRARGTCPKCGTSNQLELQYDTGWQLQCLTCSKTFPTAINTEDKRVIRRYDIGDCCIKSSMVVYCSISLKDHLSEENSIHLKLM